MPASTAQRTQAGEALRAMLPAGTDPYSTIELACHTAFLVRDREILPGVLDVVKTDPEMAASLIVALAALVDVDSRPADMLAWLGTTDGQQQETARQAAALAEARAEYNDATGDTLPPVTLESMREVAHAARLAGVMMPCGTPAAYRRHVKQEQEACPRCAWAWWLYSKATREEREILKTPLKYPVTSATTRDWGTIRCGTIGGYDAHREHGEQVCRKCLNAAAEAITAATLAQQPRETRIRPQCGSHEGYVAHRRVFEEPCDDCRAAQTAYDAARYLERKARQATCTKDLQEFGADLEDQPSGTIHQISDGQPDQQQVERRQPAA